MLWTYWLFIISVVFALLLALILKFKEKAERQDVQGFQ